MVKKLLLCLLVLVMLAIPALTACSTETTSTSTTTTTSKTTTSTTSALTTTTSTSQATATTATTTTAAKPTSINIALNGKLTTLDPTSMSGGGGDAVSNVFQTLVGFDKNNKLTPVLAESWSFSTDYLTLTVKLKKGIKFSTGDSFTAADVKFTLDRDKATAGSPTAAQLTQNFTGLTVVDDYTVAFNFPAINVQFLPQTVAGMYIVSKTQYEKLGEDAFPLQTAGTGPYKFTDYKEGQYANLTYNDQYWGTKPAITDVKFVYTADAATRISQLEAGEVDLIQDVSGSSVAQLEKAGYITYDVVQAHDIAIIFDLLDSSVPWAKLEVRQAINYMIDKEALNKTLFGGVFQKGVWLSSWELGYDASLDPVYPVNVLKARELMTAAGYPNGFTVNVYYPSYLSWSKDMIDYLSATLSQIAITIKPQALSALPTMFNTLTALHNKTVDSAILLQRLGGPGNPESVINLTNNFYPIKDNCLINNTQLADLIKQALATPDDTARAAVVQQAYQILNDTLPAIPLFLEVLVYGCDSNIVYTQSVGGTSASPVYVADLSYK